MRAEEEFADEDDIDLVHVNPPTKVASNYRDSDEDGPSVVSRSPPASPGSAIDELELVARLQQQTAPSGASIADEAAEWQRKRGGTQQAPPVWSTAREAAPVQQQPRSRAPPAAAPLPDLPLNTQPTPDIWVVRGDVDDALPAPRTASGGSRSGAAPSASAGVELSPPERSPAPQEEAGIAGLDEEPQPRMINFAEEEENVTVPGPPERSPAPTAPLSSADRANPWRRCHEAVRQGKRWLAKPSAAAPEEVVSALCDAFSALPTCRVCNSEGVDATWAKVEALQRQVAELEAELAARRTEEKSPQSVHPPKRGADQPAERWPWRPPGVYRDPTDASEHLLRCIQSRSPSPPQKGWSPTRKDGARCDAKSPSPPPPPPPAAPEPVSPPATDDPLGPSVGELLSRPVRSVERDFPRFRPNADVRRDWGPNAPSDLLEMLIAVRNDGLFTETLAPRKPSPARPTTVRRSPSPARRATASSRTAAAGHRSQQTHRAGAKAAPSPARPSDAKPTAAQYARAAAVLQRHNTQCARRRVFAALSQRAAQRLWCRRAARDQYVHSMTKCACHLSRLAVAWHVYDCLRRYALSSRRKRQPRRRTRAEGIATREHRLWQLSVLRRCWMQLCGQLRRMSAGRADELRKRQRLELAALEHQLRSDLGDDATARAKDAQIAVCSEVAELLGRAVGMAPTVADSPAVDRDVRLAMAHAEARRVTNLAVADLTHLRKLVQQYHTDKAERVNALDQLQTLLKDETERWSHS